MKDDSAISAVVGGIVLLAILSASLIYVNAFHVPRQGEAIEVAAREDAERAMASLAALLPQGAPTVQDLPLRAPAQTPPLLSGLVLSPARAAGSAAFDPAGPTIGVSVVLAAPAGGVPADDPVREALPGGLMRLHLVGNETAELPVGSLRLATGSAYLDPATYRAEGGALLLRRGGSSEALLAPPLLVGADGAGGARRTTVSLALPVLGGGAAEIAGAGSSQVALAARGDAQATGGLARNLTIAVTTDALAAWTAALTEAVGVSGTVTATSTGPDAGRVVAVILPPAGAPPNAPRVAYDITMISYGVSMLGGAG
ncbi:MAG TPA: hypothetical protein VHH36_02655 [Candidatus Thermoplasmatota archaeon]|nr:hypothetical protein [Candidatus Thermoplasmatota archaeon]